MNQRNGIEVWLSRVRTAKIKSERSLKLPFWSRHPLGHGRSRQFSSPTNTRTTQTSSPSSIPTRRAIRLSHCHSITSSITFASRGTIAALLTVFKRPAAGSAPPLCATFFASDFIPSPQRPPSTRSYTSSKRKRMPPKKAVKEERILLGRPGNSLKSGIVSRKPHF